MNIIIRLLNRLGDEIGDLNLETVRLANAGVESAVPDLADQMSQLDARLNLALARTGHAPVLDALGIRIAVSRALLNPAPEGVVIPLQVRPLDEPALLNEPAPGRASRQKMPASGSLADPESSGWDELFVLDTVLGTETGIRQSASGTALRGGNSERNPTGKDGNYSNYVAAWEALGEAWQMDDLEETDEEGGWT